MGTYDNFKCQPWKSGWQYEWIAATNISPNGWSPTSAAYDEYQEVEEWDLIATLDSLKELRQEMPSDEWDSEENN